MSLIPMRLEERVVLDGAAVDTAVQVEQAQDAAAPVPDAQPAPAQSQVETDSDEHVLVISDAISEAEKLSEAAKDGVHVVTYDADADSTNEIIDKIRDALNGEKADSIALATHGLSAGRLELTDTLDVDATTLMSTPELVDFFESLGALTDEDGRIDLLGCNVGLGDDGAQLVEKLEDITGKNVAASDDLTGNPDDGGDWQLESDGIDVDDIYFDGDELGELDEVLGSPKIPGDFNNVSYSERIGDTTFFWNQYAIGTQGLWSYVDGAEKEVAVKDQDGKELIGNFKSLTVSSDETKALLVIGNYAEDSRSESIYFLNPSTRVARLIEEFEFVRNDSVSGISDICESNNMFSFRIYDRNTVYTDDTYTHSTTIIDEQDDGVYFTDGLTVSKVPGGVEGSLNYLERSGSSTFMNGSSGGAWGLWRYVDNQGQPVQIIDAEKVKMNGVDADNSFVFNIKGSLDVSSEKYEGVFFIVQDYTAPDGPYFDCIYSLDSSDEAVLVKKFEHDASNINSGIISGMSESNGIVCFAFNGDYEADPETGKVAYNEKDGVYFVDGMTVSKMPGEFHDISNVTRVGDTTFFCADENIWYYVDGTANAVQLKDVNDQYLTGSVRSVTVSSNKNDVLIVLRTSSDDSLYDSVYSLNANTKSAKLVDKFEFDRNKEGIDISEVSFVSESKGKFSFVVKGDYAWDDAAGKVVFEEENGIYTFSPNQALEIKIHDNIVGGAGCFVRDLIKDKIDGVGEERIGIAITDIANSSQFLGQWQYSVDNGNNWDNIQDGDIEKGLLLRGDDSTRIRFVALKPWVSADNPILSFRTWDAIADQNGQFVDITSVGGATRYSACLGQIEVINNDAPTVEFNKVLPGLDSKTFYAETQKVSRPFQLISLEDDSESITATIKFIKEYSGDFLGTISGVGITDLGNGRYECFGTLSQVQDNLSKMMFTAGGNAGIQKFTLTLRDSDGAEVADTYEININDTTAPDVLLQSSEVRSSSDTAHLFSGISIFENSNRNVTAILYCLDQKHVSFKNYDQLGFLRLSQYQIKINGRAEDVALALSKLEVNLHDHNDVEYKLITEDSAGNYSTSIVTVAAKNSWGHEVKLEGEGGGLSNSELIIDGLRIDSTGEDSYQLDFNLFVNEGAGFKLSYQDVDNHPKSQMATGLKLGTSLINKVYFEMPLNALKGIKESITGQYSALDKRNSATGLMAKNSFTNIQINEGETITLSQKGALRYEYTFASVDLLNTILGASIDASKLSLTKSDEFGLKFSNLISTKYSLLPEKIMAGTASSEDLIVFFEDVIDLAKIFFESQFDLIPDVDDLVDVLSKTLTKATMVADITTGAIDLAKIALDDMKNRPDIQMRVVDGRLQLRYGEQDHFYYVNPGY